MTVKIIINITMHISSDQNLMLIEENDVTQEAYEFVETANEECKECDLRGTKMCKHAPCTPVNTRNSPARVDGKVGVFKKKSEDNGVQVA